MHQQEKKISLQFQELYELEEKLNYKFKNKELLITALTHKSFSNENRDAKDNERLEFLGDSVLSLVISDYLIDQFPNFSEGDLSKLKSKLVSKTTLSKVARRIDLGKYLFLGKGEEKTGGRKKSSILANTLEATIGSLYKDAGFEKAKNIVILLFSKELEDILKGKKDYKSILQEYTQSNFGCIPKYRIIREIGPEHEKTYFVEVFIKEKSYGIGKGKKIKLAEQMAAKIALKKLKVNFSLSSQHKAF